MTEDEAKTKWCPHSRVLDYRTNPFGAASASYNRKTNGKANCIGSDCMMWRESAGVLRNQEGRIVREVELASMTHGEVDALSLESRGYCGLAGKP